MNNTLVYTLVMLLAGIGIPTMATLNGVLGGRLQSTSLATAMALALAFHCGNPLHVGYRGFAKQVSRPVCPFTSIWEAFASASMSSVGPGFVLRFGVSNAIAFALLGQLVAMTIIDHFGLFGATQYSITLKRTLGLVLIGCRDLSRAR